MTKTGRVQTGKTPSVVSGLPSTKIVEGEPVRKGEKPVDAGLKKLASVIAPPAEDETHKGEAR